MEGESKLQKLEPGDIEAMLSEGAYIIDLREPALFGKGYIKGSINIALSFKRLERRIKMFVPPESPLILVADSDTQAEEAVLSLWEVRGEHLLGYTHDRIDAWVNAGLPVATLEQISLQELKRRLDEARGDITVLDVRDPMEWDLFGYIEGALLIPLIQVEKRRAEIPQDRELAIICDIGVRSSTAAGILERHGFTRNLNVLEGMSGWNKAGYPKVEYEE